MTTLIPADHHATLWALITVGTALSIWMEQKYRWAARLSGPVIALLIAMTLSSTGVMPAQSAAYDFVGDWLVPLAIPLLLFRANLREIIGTGGRLFLVFHLSAAGTILGTFLAFFILGNAMEQSVLARESVDPELAGLAAEHASGMMAGSYMGGGVNFMAIKESYQIDENVAGPLIVADNFVMASMFVILLWIAGSPWFRKYYPHPHSRDADRSAATNLAAEHWKRKEVGLLDVARSIGFAFAVVAVAGMLERGVAALFGDVSGATAPVRMLHALVTNPFVLITGLTLVCATVFAGQLSRINGPDEIGAYLLLVFLFTLGLPADLGEVILKAPLFFVFCGIIAVVNLAVTLLGGKLFRCQLEELTVAVNANLGGAPSAAAMAISAGWPRLVLPGILVGVWGYVVGTPVGVTVVELLTR